MAGAILFPKFMLGRRPDRSHRKGFWDLFMEVLTTAEMERADRLSIAAGTPGFSLMLSAGQAVAEAANELVEEGPILVVAGPGNNGGDGFVAAAGVAVQGREGFVLLMWGG